MEKNFDRHAKAEQVCLYCGNKFLARVERIRNGQGRFCSLQCYYKKQRQENKEKYWGFANGKKYWDGKKWSVHWYDDNHKVHTTSYPNWWWRMNVGEIQKGYCISYKDGNPKNIRPENFVCVLLNDVRRKGGINNLGVIKLKIARENSRWWRGGSSYNGYPTTFSKPLKKRIKIRDKYTCQACWSTMPSHYLDVHHIDRDVQNNDENNLVTLCRSCHSGVHKKSEKTNERILYYQSLLPK